MEIAPQNLFVWNPHWQCFACALAPCVQMETLLYQLQTVKHSWSSCSPHPSCFFPKHEVWNQNECAEHVIEALNMSKPQVVFAFWNAPQKVANKTKAIVQSLYWFCPGPRGRGLPRMLRCLLQSYCIKNNRTNYSQFFEQKLRIITFRTFVAQIDEGKHRKLLHWW